MAKQKLNMNGHDPEDYYTTAKGVTVRFLKMNPLTIQKFQNAGKVPEVPYRETGVPELGEVQKEPLSANDLQNDEEKQQWLEYVRELNQLEEKRGLGTIKAMLFYGLEIDDSNIDEWKREQEEAFGFETPTNRIDLKYDYVNSEIIGDTEDLTNIIAGITRKANPGEEKLSEVRDTFRNTIRQDSVAEAGEIPT